jgi:hypothetical protein
MPSRALLTESQTIPSADITQVLANIGVTRVALGSNVTRTSATGTTLTPTGLTALAVTLAQSSRYRLTYRLYVSGANGFKIALTFPSALPTFDGQLVGYDSYNAAGFIYNIPDWPGRWGASGVTIMEAPNDASQYGGLQFIADILTGSTANTYGDFAITFAQYVSGATASTMTKNSCVEVLKY